MEQVLRGLLEVWEVRAVIPLAESSETLAVVARARTLCTGLLT